MVKAPVQELFQRVTADPWRPQVGFSADLADAQKQMLNASTGEDVADVLNTWLQLHQPCLFGRLAARCNQLSYCILDESDLLRDDLFIRDKIQRCRTDWTRNAFKGTRSGFVILAVSERLLNAAPNQEVAALAHRLAELYLLDDVAFDAVHFDEVYLEQPGDAAAVWRWHAGVNYFASHGDKRWWHDHRIPGGIGFSINSVGHMAKSGLMRNALAKLDEVMGTNEDSASRAKIESLTKALELAMTTIDRAQDTVSGKATRLLSLPDNPSSIPARPELPDFLSGKNHCEYFGYYHTDFTLPSEYFLSDVARPSELSGHTLDFTYLFDPSVDNPAYKTMGEGRRLRKWGDQAASRAISARLTKAVPASIPFDDAPRLRAITS